MTFADAKKSALVLIEEYSPTNNLLTDDVDIQNRIAIVFNLAYDEMSRLKKIRKTAVLDRSAIGEDKFYRSYDLPTDMYQLDEIVVKDLTTNEIINDGDFYIEYPSKFEAKIFINDQSLGAYTVRYFAKPTIINELTSDTFVLELDDDALSILPYEVAADILRADVSADYDAFDRVYREKRDRLDIRKTTGTVTFTKSSLDGAGTTTF